MGKFGPVAGLSTRAKNMGKISTFDAPSSPASLETQAMRSALSGPALGGAGMVGDAISDACLFLARRGFTVARLRFAAYPPCFEIVTFQSVNALELGPI